MTTRRNGPRFGMAVAALAAGLAVPTLVPPAGANAAPLGAPPLAGFRSTVARPGALSVWTNPAATGLDRRPVAAMEMTWERTGSPDDRSWDSVPAGTLFAAGNAGSVYGAHLEGEDAFGREDWSLAWGEARALPQGGALGATLLWRGGEGGAFDLIAGALVPFGRSLELGVVGRDLFEADVDGLATERSGTAGLAWKPRDLPGRVTWDWRFAGPGGAPSDHLVGIAFDRTDHIRLTMLADLEGSWTARGGVVRRHWVFGLASHHEPGDGRSAWLFAEWRAPSGPRGFAR